MVAGPCAGAEIPTFPTANPGHPVPAPTSSKSQVSKSPIPFPTHGPQPPLPLPGTLLGGALPPSPLRDPSGPTSSGLCTSRGSRPHGDASRSIPAGSQCGGGGGDGGTILRPGLSALRPRPSPPAHSATPRGPGCPAPAPKAGRLDPGPLWPAGPLPSPPRGPASTHKVSACFGALTGPHALCPRRRGGLHD